MRKRFLQMVKKRVRSFRLFSLLVCLTVWFPCLGQDSPVNKPAGEGTEEKPYQISTKEELEWFRDQVNLNSKNRSLCAVLINDIDLNNEEWTEPIRYNSSYGYNGHFNGNNHTIKGLNINAKEQESNGEGYQCAGLFGCISYSTGKGDKIVIENLTVEGTVRGTNNVGGIVGIARGFQDDHGSVKNCTFIGTVESSTTYKAPMVGGIVGYLWGGNIYSCISKATITANSSSSEKTGYIGGIIGSIANGCKIKDCISASTVSGNVGNIDGICGNIDSRSDISNCFFLSGDGLTETAGKTIAVTEEDLRNGKVCYLINKGKEEAIWGQKIGENQYPIQWVFVPEAEKDLYKVYNVTLDYGIEGQENIPFYYNAEVILPKPERKGYIFEGWYDQETDGTKVESFPIDGKNYTYYAYWTKSSYSITLVQTAGGTISVDEQMVAEGEIVMLTAIPNSGYHFDRWNVVSGTVSIQDNKFTMPAENVEIQAFFKPCSYGEPVYTWSEDNTTCTATRTCENDVTHTETATATVTSKQTQAPTCTEKGEMTYTATFSETWAETQTTTEVIDATGHGETEIQNAKEATCTEDGYTGDEVCTVCGEVVTAGEIIPATGHHYVNGYCTECGQRDPDYRPDPISYYNIYVENVCDGVEVSTSKQVVREGGSITVYVEKDTANYTFDNFKVYYKRSYYGGWEELKEGTQPGEYPIKNIWTHIYIKAEGAEKKEDPTGIESIEGVKVYTKDGSLYVQTPQREQVIIVSMSGAVVKNEEQVGLKQYHGLRPGIYIVRVGDRAYKLRLH